MAELWVAATVTGVASLGGAYVMSQASGAASAAQIAAGEQQIAMEENEFNSVQRNEAPWMGAGRNALQTLMAGFAPGGQFSTGYNPGSFQSSPAYQGYLFQQNQGNAAVQANAAAKGMALSPATSAALAKFNQGLASTDYQNWYNTGAANFYNQQGQEIAGLSGIAGMGLTATGQTNQAGQAATAGMVNAEGSIGNAQAAGILGSASAINSGIQGAVSGITTPLMMQYYASLFNDRPPPPTPAPPTPAPPTPTPTPAPTPAPQPPGNPYDPNAPDYIGPTPINAGTFNTSNTSGFPWTID